jgi:hypothetical protein
VFQLDLNSDNRWVNYAATYADARSPRLQWSAIVNACTLHSSRAISAAGASIMRLVALAAQVTAFDLNGDAYSDAAAVVSGERS